MLWIGLYLPLLSLEALRATLAPDQACLPLALLQAHEIAQADAAAQALGVRTGMKRATALALAPNLLLGQAEPRRDAQARRAVAHVALAYTPSVACDAERPAEVRLEVQASLRCFGGLERLLQRLRQDLQPLGHEVRLAVAPTAQAASLLVRWGEGFERGAHVQGGPALHRLLDAVPVALLLAARPHLLALEGMGLRTLGDLRALPRSGLARRCGQALLDEIDRARGDAPEPQAWTRHPPSFGSRVELYARADTTAQVLAGARVLLARLVAWAQAGHGRVGRYTLVLHHEPRHRSDARTPERTALEVALAEPSADAQHLQLLLAERLARVEMPAPALELSLQCEALVPGTPPNAELFPTRASQREGLLRLVERLQARLGHEQVCHLVPRADHRPERATELRPVDAARMPAAAAGMVPGVMWPALQPGEPLLRPLWLLPEPLRLGGPASGEGGPGGGPDTGPDGDMPQGNQQRRGASGPLLDGRALQVLAGPERIETGWWDGALVLRDYYIAATPEGSLVWVFRHRLPGQAGPWFLHGRFG